MPEVHAILSASSSKRWLNCTPSARLEQNFPNESSVFAEEGTAAHALGEYKLRKYLHERVQRPTSEYENEEMEANTDIYAEFIISTVERIKETCPHKKTLLAIHKAVEAAKEDGKVRKWGGKLPPNLKLPLRDGDIDRPDDENYQEHFFLNATSKDAPQVVDRHVQPVVDPMMVYSGCFCNVSVNFYPFNANGNRGVAVGLGNIQFVKDGDRLSGRASADADFDALPTVSGSNALVSIDPAE